jgi:Flp pilus assembly protein TadD
MKAAALAFLAAVLALQPAAAAVEARPAVQGLVAAAIAGDRSQVNALASQIKSQPRAPRGDRRRARELNERGLALWQRQRYEEASTYFREAREADPGDAEIAENLGYALLKAGHVGEAEPPLLDALSLAPERASAWGSLGMIYAKQGKHRAGVALVLTAYSYARDPKRTAGVYSRLAATDDDPKVRAMLAEVVSKLPGT